MKSYLLSFSLTHKTAKQWLQLITWSYMLVLASEANQLLKLQLRLLNIRPIRKPLWAGWQTQTKVIYKGRGLILPLIWQSYFFFILFGFKYLIIMKLSLVIKWIVSKWNAPKLFLLRCPLKLLCIKLVNFG